jgi:group I intron endonuclease
MKVQKEHKNKAGIYCITNLVNNKKYIGKSINIASRIANHICGLNKKSKDCNRYLIASWHKYGKDCFNYEIIEELDKNNNDISNLLKDKELFWMNYFNTTDRNYGYNLRKDSSSQTFVHEDTKELIRLNVLGKKNPNYGNKWNDVQKKEMSEKIKKTYQDGNRKQRSYEDSVKGSITRLKMYKENPQLKIEHIKKQSRNATKYYIEQYSKNRITLIKKWNTVCEILIENTNYKKHNLYAVCSGEKPSMYGYWWKKVLIDDKVQTELKDSE